MPGPCSAEIAVAVVCDGPRVLIGRRPAGVPLAGLWEFPGGKVRPGESPEVAAARECLEETGLVVQVGGLYLVAEHEYPQSRLRLHFFAAEPIDPRRPPAQPFRWVPIAELAAYPMPPANAAVVRVLAESPKS